MGFELRTEKFLKFYLDSLSMDPPSLSVVLEKKSQSRKYAHV